MVAHYLPAEAAARASVPTITTGDVIHMDDYVQGQTGVNLCAR